MSSPSNFLSEEQFQCSVCLNVFTNPVSTPCGHTFCMSCIEGYWDSSGLCQCPRCEKCFPVRPELCENTFAREMCERLRGSRAVFTDGPPVAPGEVPCDLCPGRKLKALKSCLVCLASYCSEHVKAHGVRFTKHKLVEPVDNLEDRMCQKHERPLELFCRSDQTCVCVLCTETDHKTHDTVPVEMEWVGKKTQLGKTETDVEQMIQDRLKKVEEIKKSVELSKGSTKREVEDSVQVFTALVSSIERSQAELIEVIEEKQRAAERRAEGLIKELEQEIAELKRRHTELEQLSHTEDYIHFLQSFPSLCAPPHTKDWSEVTVHSDLCVGTLRRAVAKLEEMLQTEENKQLEKELRRMSEYAVDVTLDPSTANPWLVLSEDGKQVRDGDVQRVLPDNPERFDTAPCVLGKEVFTSGRHYWEVQVGDKTAWDLGVALASVKRKGLVTLGPGEGFWTVCLRNKDEYRACVGPAVLLHQRERPQKVGVYVDYEGGQVSFYNVEARSHIYSFTGYNFTEGILPMFNPDTNDDGSNITPLIISPVNHKGGGGVIL